MNLDVNTLLALMLANMFAMAVAVPAVIGWRVSRSARFVVASAVTQALAWGSFLLARPVPERIFSTLWIGLLGVSFVCMWYALRGWLGPRPGRAPMLAVAVLTPMGYGLGFDDYTFRVGWSNFGLGTMMLCVCLACAWPAPHAGRRWRGLIMACLGSLALVTFGRGVLGAFFSELYPTLRTPHPLNVIGAVLNHIALTLTTIGLLVGWHEEAERKLRIQAETDSLTGLLNRHAWRQRAERALDTARRHREPLAVLLLDIDHFKRINDVGGHEAGDLALQRIAHTLRDCVRRSDLVCRYGGEEFCLMLARTGAEAAHEVDRRVRASLREDSESIVGLPLSFSTGLAVLNEGDANLDSVLRRADKALCAAKSGGRNRLVRASDRGPTSQFLLAVPG